MFKRVKSLLIGGVLVLGMSASAFADGTPEWKLDYGTVDGVVRTIEASEMITKAKWDAFVGEVNKMQNGFVIVSEKEEEKAGVFNVYSDADYDNDKTEIKEDELIETINIEYLVIGEDGLQKGVIESIMPETGDAIAIGGAVMGIASIGALAFVNKKRK